MRPRQEVGPVIRLLVGGMAALAIAMAIGRFAYTPLLPLMQREHGLGADEAGILASVNYAGYLVGALLSTVLATAGRRVWLLRSCLVLSIASTAAMGLTALPLLWMALRFLSGIASAGIFVIGSGLVLEALAAYRAPRLHGVVYSGIGLGIALSGLAVAALDELLGVDALWLALAALSVPLAWMAMRWLGEQRPAKQTLTIPAGTPLGAARLLPWLALAYFCEGLGYIVTGTFLVAIVQEAAGRSAGTTTWVLVGLSSAASIIVWPYVAERIGGVWAIVVAHLLQAVGIALPALSSGAAAAYAGAVLFGGTFVAIAVMSVVLGKRLLPQHSDRAIGLLTAAFGTGQIIGPLLAGLLAAQTQSFRLPLLGAAAIVAFGAALLVAGEWYRRIGVSTYQERRGMHAIRQYQDHA